VGTDKGRGPPGLRWPSSYSGAAGVAIDILETDDGVANFEEYFYRG
jgi:hypothetical protein